jgi:hypothetical protein
MAKRRGGRFKTMMGLGFISFDKAFSFGFIASPEIGPPTIVEKSYSN